MFLNISLNVSYAFFPIKARYVFTFTLYGWIVRLAVLRRTSRAGHLCLCRMRRFSYVFDTPCFGTHRKCNRYLLNYFLINNIPCIILLNFFWFFLRSVIFLLSSVLQILESRCQTAISVFKYSYDFNIAINWCTYTRRWFNGIFRQRSQNIFRT